MKHFLTQAAEYTNLDPYYTLKKNINMTAVEWLIEQFKIYLPSIHQKGLNDAFEQAKIMEKEQIIKAYDKGYDDVDVYEPEKYFNETYKKDNP